VPDALLIFLAPPSMEGLEARLRSRGLDDPETIRRRLDAAARELQEQSRFDYVVVNEQDALDQAVDRVLGIMEAERKRAGRKPVRIS
jgi:guanylate kinase